MTKTLRASKMTSRAYPSWAERFTPPVYPTGMLLADADAAGVLLVLLGDFGLAGGQAAVHEVIGDLDVLLVLRAVAAGEVGLVAVEQVEVGHGVGIVRTQIEGGVELGDAVINLGVGGLGHGLAAFLGGRRRFLGDQRLQLVGDALGLLGEADRRMDFGVVDGSESIVRGRVLGGQLQRLAVVLAGIVEVAHVVFEAGEAGDGVLVVGVLVEHDLVLVNGLLGHAHVVGGGSAGNELGLIGSGQVQLGVHQRG